MSTADEIAAAFGKVDELLLARAQEQGVTEAAMLRHLRLNSTTARWILKLEPAAADRSIDLDGDDLGELVLRWVRS